MPSEATLNFVGINETFHDFLFFWGFFSVSDFWSVHIQYTCRFLNHAQSIYFYNNTWICSMLAYFRCFCLYFFFLLYSLYRYLRICTTAKSGIIVWSARNLIPPKWQLESKFSSTSHVGFWVLFSMYMANRWRCLAIASPQVSLSTMLEWNKASLPMPDITILLITTSLPSNTAETYFHLRYWIIMIMGKMSYSYSTLCKANVHYCKNTSVICKLEHFFLLY